MMTDEPSFARLLGLAGLLVLWFLTVWQSFVIERTRARLAGLKQVWLEVLASDPAWPHCAAIRTVHAVIETNGQRLPRLSLSFLLMRALLRNREMRDSCARVRASLGTLPAGRLREEAALIVESVARHVAFAALQRSLLVWALAPLILVLFVFWSVHWHLRIVLCGASAGTIELARLRLRRKLLEPLVQGVVGSI